jgi:hypothetical protein
VSGWISQQNVPIALDDLQTANDFSLFGGRKGKKIFN